MNFVIFDRYTAIYFNTRGAWRLLTNALAHCNALRTHPVRQSIQRRAALAARPPTDTRHHATRIRHITSSHHHNITTSQHHNATDVARASIHALTRAPAPRHRTLAPPPHPRSASPRARARVNSRRLRTPSPAQMCVRRAAHARTRAPRPLSRATGFPVASGAAQRVLHKPSSSSALCSDIMVAICSGTFLWLE